MVTTVEFQFDIGQKVMTHCGIPAIVTSLSKDCRGALYLVQPTADKKDIAKQVWFTESELSGV